VYPRFIIIPVFPPSAVSLIDDEGEKILDFLFVFGIVLFRKQIVFPSRSMGSVIMS
jgi:hypothetical protein